MKVRKHSLLTMFPLIPFSMALSGIRPPQRERSEEISERGKPGSEQWVPRFFYGTALSACETFSSQQLVELPC